MAEAIALFSCAVAAGLLLVALLSEWWFAVVPALTYGLAIAVSYGLFAHFREVEADTSTPLESVTRFRVVGTRGRCVLLRGEGDVIKVGPAGAVIPPLCAPAERVLRFAAGQARSDVVEEWCCPVYDHMLVFREAREAAPSA